MAIIPDNRQEGNPGVGQSLVARFLNGIPEGVLSIAILLCASLGSFGLGVLYARDTTPQESVRVCTTPLSTSGDVLGTSQSVTTTVEPQLSASQGQYVASKKGSKYHLPWCPGAKAMSEENKIYFDSKEVAEAAGYAPAANCKGL